MAGAVGAVGAEWMCVRELCERVGVCGGLQRRWRTVPVSKLLLIMPLITNQLANATGPGGLTLAQHVRN